MPDLVPTRPAGREHWHTLWRQLRAGWCRHRDPVRVHLAGVWIFEYACGHRVPIARTTQERAHCRRLVDGAQKP